MALAAFWAAEALGGGGQPKTKRPWHPFGGIKRSGATLAILASLGLLVLPQPGLEARLERAEIDLQRALDAREVQIDPGELLDLMHNNQVRLVLVDLRAEVDFNLFHLLDSKRVALDDLRSNWTNTLPGDALVILMGNDEELAAEAWKILQVQNVTSSYILAGGLNGWLDVYGSYSELKLERFTSPEGATPRGVLAYNFPAALGDRIDIAWPDAKHMSLPDRPYEKKAKAAKKAVSSGGGCG
jgi:rhodanese-related sulfurtransferase